MIILQIIVFMGLGSALCQNWGEIPAVKLGDLEGSLRDMFSQPRNYLNPEHTAHLQQVRGYIKGIFQTLSRPRAGVVFDEDVFWGVATHGFGNVSGTNYYLTFRGTEYDKPSDKIVVVTAHYESYQNASGTDNNGSGISALIELAKLLVQMTCPRQYTVILVANDLEEYGSLGMKHFIYEFLVPKVLKNEGPDAPEFQGAVVLETMMNWDNTHNSQNLPVDEFIFEDLDKEQFDYWNSTGRRGNFLLSLSRNSSDFPLNRIFPQQWEAIAPGDEYDSLGLPLPFPFDIPVLPPNFSQIPILGEALRQFFRGDFKEFYLYNGTIRLSAMMITDSGNHRGYMRQCYAKSCDNASQITPKRIEFLGKTVMAVLRTISHMTGYNCPQPAPSTALPTTGGCSTVHGQGWFILLLMIISVSIIFNQKQ